MSSDKPLWADELLWDHLIVDCDGKPVGMVDDLELVDPDDGAGPVLTAFLCGPTALGPRLGGRLGVWLTAIAGRLRQGDDAYPRRIPFSVVEKIDARHVELSVPREVVPTAALRLWVRDRIVGRIPGSGV